MSIRRDISKGIDPVPVYSDIRNDCYVCFVDGKRYRFERLPFTIKEFPQKGKLTRQCADKALVLKHADKAIVTEIATQESLHA